MSQINTSSPSNDNEGSEKKPGRPVNPESARQKRERELTERRERGELTLGRPKEPDSKRQQELAAKAAKLMDGVAPAKGRPKMTEEEKVAARQKREEEQREARLRWAAKNPGQTHPSELNVIATAIVHEVASEDVEFIPTTASITIEDGDVTEHVVVEANIEVEAEAESEVLDNVDETETETVTPVVNIEITAADSVDMEVVTPKPLSAKQRKQARKNAVAPAQNNEENAE